MIFQDEKQSTINKIKTEKKECYIMGDFNINLLNYETHNQTRDFIDSMFANSFKPLIDKPTRVTAFSTTLIDNIFSNDILSNNQHSCIFYTDISDHFPIFLIEEKRNIEVVDEPEYVRCFNDKNKHSFISLINDIDWSNIRTYEDAQEAYTAFSMLISEAYERAFPLIRKRTKQRYHRQWITRSIKHSINVKNKLYKRYITTPTVHNKIRCAKYKRMLSRIIKTSERLYYHDQLIKNKHNLRFSWRILKEIIGKSDKTFNKVNTIFQLNDNRTSDREDISNAFNEFFTEIGPKLAEKIPNVHSKPKDYLKGHTQTHFIFPLQPAMKLCLQLTD